MITLKNACGAAIAATFVSVSAVGCGPDKDTTPGTTSTGGSANGGASSTGGGPTGGTAPGGGSANGGGGSGGIATSGGGFAGAGGSGASGGAGGSGGASSACLDGSSFADLFTVQGSDLCPVAVYTAAAMYDFHYVATSWGLHGGPLFIELDANMSDVDLKRWTPPTGASGAFTIATTTAPAQIPSGAYLGSQALDLGFFGWTAISDSGPSGTAGEIVLIYGTTIVKRYPVNGPFAFASIADDADSGRLLYSGLSTLDDAMTDKNGLFAADSCGTSAMSPSLEPGSDVTCTAPSLVDAWDEASGPVAVDTLGNAFAVFTSFTTGDQKAHGYSKTQVARGAAPVVGSTLFTLPGFGTSLAAVPPTGTDDGILAFQPSDGSTYKALDVVAQKYNLGAGGITATGTPVPLLTLTTEDTALAMTTDPSGRLWVGGARSDGTTVFVVLARP